jgi:hypothetical protein
VDKQHFATLGIDATRLYGTKAGEGKSTRYDGKALTGALEAIIGRRDRRPDRSRRNTLDG